MKRVWVGMFVTLGLSMVAGAQGPGRSLTFSLDRAQPLVQYTVAVSEGGEGTYSPHLPSANLTTGADTSLPESPKALRVEPALVKKLFAAVPMVEGGRCETHSKSVAKTGVKVLHYVGAGRDAQCTFNYSDDERVNNAAEVFQALAETMQYGERLQSKLRFDRLGLDTELEGLEEAAAAGRALEVRNIAPVLNSIAQDERVMDRVRRRAEKLLGSPAADQAMAGAVSVR